MSPRTLNRRTLLRGAVGASIGLPFLEAMLGKGGAFGASPVFPKRFLVFYTPNGTVPDSFWPTGSGPDFTLSPILEPLARHKDDLLVLGGVDMASALAGPGDAHQKGTGQCLTATELSEGTFPGDAGETAGWANNLSIDQHIANTVGADTAFKSLELGCVVQGSDVYSRLSYSAPGQPIPPENSPYAAYNRLFASALGDPTALAQQRLRRQAVLDLVRTDYDKLNGSLGAEDRVRLEAHVASIQALRDRLDAPSLSFGGECQPLDQGLPIDTELVANVPLIGQLHMDLIAMAFACDQVRVASIMWGYSRCGHVYSWADPQIAEGHHLIAHKGDEDTKKVEQNIKIGQWHAEQLASLIDRLKAIPEGDGSVFDNTVILWTNEQSKGNNHLRTDMPYVLAGSAGGYFATGQYVVQPQNVGHQRLMVSLMNAMGVEGDTFGDPEYGTGPLPGINA